MVLLAWLSFRIVPEAGVRAQELRIEAMRAAQFGALEAGRFRSFAGGDAVFYAEKVERSGQLEGVFVQRRVKDRLEIAVAERAEQRGAGQAEQLFVLYDGRRYEGVPGSREWRVVEFAEHGIPVRMPEYKARRERRELKSTRDLLGSDDPGDRSEIAWRTAVPLMALVLMALAVPLAKLRPRQGRFARVGLAVLAYFMYSNLVAAVRVWIEKDSPGGQFGMWWVHLLPLALAGWLLWRELHLRPLWRRRKRRPDMPILGNYIVRTVLGYTALVMLVLLALGALFIFIGQQDDIGTGGYTASQALLFVALNLPSYLFQLLPVGALIGALLGLGNLARGSELVVMRASGVTTARFCLWLGVAGFILAVLMVAVGEYVAPPLEKYARQLKVFSKFNEFSFAGSRGTWVRDGDMIISVEQQSAQARFGGVQVFRFDDQRRLLAVGRADSASVDDASGWQLEGFAETRFTDQGTEAGRAPTRQVKTSLSTDFLGLAVVEPETMGLRDLRAYRAHLERNNLDATQFEAAFWARIARVVALMLVVILALPFALGPMRASGQGARTVVGILIGAGFVLLSQTLESSARLLDLPPWLVGWGPTALLAALTLVLLARLR